MTRTHLLGVLALLYVGARDGTALSTAAPSALEPEASLLRFEANMGQWDPHVQLVARSREATLSITDEAMTLTAQKTSVTLKLVGAKPTAARGEQALASRSNYFLGNDPKKWRSNVPNFARARVHDWLPGVDVVWHAGRGGVEYDVEVAAGVDARQLEWAFDATSELKVTPDGALHVGDIVQRPARVLQNHRELETRYELVDASHVRLAIEGYRPEEALLIDPVLAFSTYLGGSGSDAATAVALDASGAIYVTGSAGSTDFPLKGALQATPGGGGDVFVTKLDPSGSSIIYSTYLGGSGSDGGSGIAVDAGGDVFVVGSTDSTNFPTHAPLQAANGGSTDMFVAELNATGAALVYSTYLGGSGGDVAGAIALDSSGNAYVTGWTSSLNFPTKNAFQSTSKTNIDAVVAKLNASGSALVYSTYLGGSALDYGFAIAVDGSGSAYVGGLTASTDFATLNPLRPCDGNDGFITKLSATGSSLAYSTCLGATGYDRVNGIAVDASGNAYVTGATGAADFPTQNPIQPNKKSPWGASVTTAFVSKLNSAGSALVYSTYLGGTGSDRGTGIVVDTAGNAFVVGNTSSTDFPTHNAFQPTNAGGFDVFVTKINAAGSALSYSTYLGGSGNEYIGNVAVDATGTAVVVGSTGSSDFPTTGALQAKNAGPYDVFVAKIAEPDLAPGAACTPGACASTFCVDGFCCSTACTDTCAACDVDGSVGTCVPVTGSPHAAHPRCDDAGTTGTCAPICDGTDTKTCAYPSNHTVCSSMCKQAAETDELCDGVGNCGGPGQYAVRSCHGLTCTADGGACKASCTTESDCTSGYTCADGGCVVGTSCIDDHTSQPPYGAPEECSPYKCAGGCKTSCTSVMDCVAPNVCTLDGKCAPAEAPTTTSGCGCGVATTGQTRPWLLGLLVVSAAACRRRRR